MGKICNVYVSSFPFDTESIDVFPIARKEEINSCKSEKSKAEKFYDWKLLELAIKETFGKDIENISFTKVDGKWMCDDCFFSLSHSGNLVAVAVSNERVGLDVEKVDFERFAGLKIDKLLTPKEKEKYNSLDANSRPQFLNVAWSQKESIFKKSDEKIFTPNKIDTLSESVVVQEVSLSGENYYITITGGTKNIDYHYLNGVILNVN